MSARSPRLINVISATALDTWRDFFDLRVAGWGLDVHVGILLAAIVIALLALGALARGRSGRWQVTQADFTFAGCASMTICPTDDVAGLAHQAWVELTTRKAALPFDEENDVIVEVYNSWYELFRALRELAKNVPVRKGLRKDSDAAKLVEILSGALNTGLRPHLTRWQARFRRWYQEESNEPACANLSPQEIQQRFPQYDELIVSLTAVNSGLIDFAESLREIAHDRQKYPWWILWSPKRKR